MGMGLTAAVRLEQNVAIPVEDGVELMADAVLPEGDGPFPTLLSLYPYHKEGITALAYGSWAQEFAAHGYASLLVDLRGTGSSSGDPAAPHDVVREGLDGAAAVEWAASQPWCDGNVGLYGMSYGGFTALSTAAQRPSALKAIAAMHAPADVFTEVNSFGGCETLRFRTTWSTLMLAVQLSPPGGPDPDGRRKARWRERLEESEPHLLPWRFHRDDPGYWSSRSIDLERIEVPSLLFGGWRDLFPMGAVRQYGRIPATSRLIVGPWTHDIPRYTREPLDEGAEMRRWFDRWLRGVENGVDEEPPVSLYVQGRDSWRAAADWPPPDAREEVLYLTAERSLEESCVRESASVVYGADPTVGVRAGHQEEQGDPLEQSEDDERSLTYTGPALEEALEITGWPEAALHVGLDGEEANLTVRLCDVAPTGESTLITKGWSQLRAPLAAGELTRVSLAATSYFLAPGHRLRLSVSCADFPTLWPTPENPLIALHTGGERPSQLRFAALAPAERPADLPLWDSGGESDGSSSLDFRAERDPVADEVRVSLSGGGEGTSLGGEKFAIEQRSVVELDPREPGAARFTGTVTIRQQLEGGASAVVEARSDVTRSTMYYGGRVTIDGEIAYEGAWTDYTELDRAA